MLNLDDITNENNNNNKKAIKNGHLFQTTLKEF